MKINILFNFFCRYTVAALFSGAYEQQCLVFIACIFHTQRKKSLKEIKDVKWVATAFCYSFLFKIVNCKINNFEL